MAISFRAAATAANGAAPVSLTVNKPAGTVDGDVMVAFVAISADKTITAAPSGWTLLDSRSTGTASGDSLTAVYTKVAASEGATYTWDFSGGADAAGVIVAYSGVSTSSPVNVSGYRLMASSTVTHTAPSVTPGSADTVTLSAYAVNPFATDDTTFTTPSGLTVRGEADPGAGTTNRAVVKVFDKTTAAAAATGDQTTTLNHSAKGVAFTVTLAPLVAAALTITVQPYRVAATATGCMVGWYDQNGYATNNGLTDMETTLDTFFPLFRVYHAADDWGTVKSSVSTAIDDGRLVFASHKLPKVPNAWIAFHSTTTYDAGLAAIVAAYKDLAPAEIVVAFHHEPYGNSSSGSQRPTLGATADFRKAFRKFANAFRDAGADHIKICYCEVDSRARQYPNDPCYPGDDVVDVLGHDVYNWGNYDGHSWEEPSAMLAGIVADAKAANKPLVMGEVGSHPGGYSGHDRAQWLRDLAAYLKTGDAATYVLGFCFYHVDAHDPANPHYWRFAQGTTSTAGQVTAFKEAFSADSYFLTEPISPSLRGAQADPGGLGEQSPSGGTPPSVQGKTWTKKSVTGGIPTGYGEMSGVASSPKGGLWGIRDSDSFGPVSGVKNTLYWLTQTSRGNLSPHEITVTGATNGDWEDCFYSVESGTAYVYIHDNRDGNSTGTNPRRLYKVAEPATPSAVTTVALTATYYWKFPASASSSTCGSKQNCEAMAIFKGVIYAIQKTDAPEAQVYRLGTPGSLSPTEGAPTEGTLVGTIGTHCPSAFSISADGTTVVTIQHGETEVWRGKGDTIQSLLTGKNTRVFSDNPGGSGEGADWWPYQSSDFIVVSEDRSVFDYDVTTGTVLTSGIPSVAAFGSPTVTMGGPIAVAAVGAILAPGDYESPEETAGADFGTALVTLSASSAPDPALEGAYLFSPPVVFDLPAVLPATRGVQYRLWRYYGGNPRGLSVLKTGGVYHTVDTPDQLQIAEATEYYAGGHIYTVSSDVATALTAAGYGDSLQPVPSVRSTWATYASWTWGELRGYTWGEL